MSVDSLYPTGIEVSYAPITAKGCAMNYDICICRKDSQCTGASLGLNISYALSCKLNTEGIAFTVFSEPIIGCAIPCQKLGENSHFHKSNGSIDRDEVKEKEDKWGNSYYKFPRINNNFLRNFKQLVNVLNHIHSSPVKNPTNIIFSVRVMNPNS